MRNISQMFNLRPSSASRWMQCPVSALVALIPRPYESNVYAAKGTGVMAHIEVGLNELVDEDYFDALIDKTERVDGFDVTYAQADVDSAKKMFAAVTDLEAQGGELSVERPVKAHIAGVEIKGTLDFCAEFEDHYTIQDYKNGVVPVYAMNNGQILLYLICLIAMRGKKEYYNLEIIQPASLDQNATHTHWSFTHKQFEGLYESVVAAVERVKHLAKRVADEGEIPMGAYIPNDKCKYCAIEHTCPGRINAAISTACFTGLSFDGGKHLKFLLDNSKLVGDVIKGAEEYADSQLLEGKEVFGYKLIEVTGNRSLRKNLTKEEIEELRAAKLVEKVDKMPTITLIEKAGKKGLIEPSAFIADGEKKPKRVAWEVDGTPWNGTKDFEAGEVAKTEV